MRLPARPPHARPPGPTGPRIAATVPLRILGLLLLVLAIVIPGCQALISGIASIGPPTGGGGMMVRGAAPPHADR